MWENYELVHDSDQPCGATNGDGTPCDGWHRVR